MGIFTLNHPFWKLLVLDGSQLPPMSPPSPQKAKSNHISGKRASRRAWAKGSIHTYLWTWIEMGKSWLFHVSSFNSSFLATIYINTSPLSAAPILACLRSDSDVACDIAYSFDPINIISILFIIFVFYQNSNIWTRIQCNSKYYIHFIYIHIRFKSVKPIFNLVQ